MNKIVEKLYKKKEEMPDLNIRKITNNLKSIYVIRSEGLTSTDSVNDFVLKYLSYKSSNILNIPSINAINIKEEEIFFYLLNGFVIVIDNNTIIAFEARATLDRGINEPSSEPSIRGSKDAFTENYQKNIGLIRRRIKDEKLILKEFYMGEITKTKIGVLYLDELVDKKLVNDVINKLNLIINKNLIDSNNLRELLVDSSSLFPRIKTTEVPNNASRSLLEGKIIITVDNTPSVLIIPSFFIDFFKNNEDYNIKPLYSSISRIIRILSFFIAILLPGFYIALTNYDQEIIPISLLINFSIQRANVPFPTIIETLILLITFEILHEGDTRIPNNVGSSLSILGALVLGQSAVSAGLISPIIVIVVALSSICSLIFVYHDIEGVIRVYRYLIMILSSLFGIIGFLTGILCLLINLCKVNTFNIPYLTPIIQYKKKSLKDSIFRKSSKYLKEAK